jgi:hypothetical protein
MCVRGLIVCGTGASKNLGTLRRSGCWLRVDNHGPAPHRSPKHRRQTDECALLQFLRIKQKESGAGLPQLSSWELQGKEANLCRAYHTTASPRALRILAQLDRWCVRREQGGKGMRVGTVARTMAGLCFRHGVRQTGSRFGFGAVGAQFDSIGYATGETGGVKPAQCVEQTDGSRLAKEPWRPQRLG